MDNLDKDFRCGFIAVIGRPNAGKSTLINALVGSKVSIVSAVPQTTRFQIRAVMNGDKFQAVFVDTPGIHSFKEELASQLNTVAQNSLEGCDLIIYVTDSSRVPGKEEERIMDLLLRTPTKIIMAINKMDLGKGAIYDYVKIWKEKVAAKGIVDPVLYFLPLSALDGSNLDALNKAIQENLPLGHPFYDTDTLTDFPMKFRVADIIREKLFTLLKDELPHSLAVEIESIENRSQSKRLSQEDRKQGLKDKTLKKKLTYIKAIIYVNRNSQKAIVIGKKGCILKQIGQDSRQELEKIFNRRIYLEILVKVVADWQKRPRILKDLGYIE